MHHIKFIGKLRVMHLSVYFMYHVVEVTVPVSLKEVGGYIEKQVAYLSGECSFYDIYPYIFTFIFIG